MGSNINAKRKKLDNPIIKIPNSIFSSRQSVSGLPELASEKCISSFDEKLEDSPLLKEGISVQMKATEERILILIQGSEIGILSKRNSARVKECLALKVRYKGKIIKKQNEYYARFIREVG